MTALVVCIALLSASQSGRAIRFEPYQLTLDDGTKVEAERGRLTVPQRSAMPWT